MHTRVHSVLQALIKITFLGNFLANHLSERVNISPCQIHKFTSCTLKITAEGGIWSRDWESWSDGKVFTRDKFNSLWLFICPTSTAWNELAWGWNRCRWRLISAPGFFCFLLLFLGVDSASLTEHAVLTKCLVFPQLEMGLSSCSVAPAQHLLLSPQRVLG